MNFSIEEINEVLGKIDFNLWSEPTDPVKRIRGHQGIAEGSASQGEYNEFFDIYPTSIPDYFVKVTIQTDSYGEDEKVKGIKIVKGKEKTITVYEVE